MSRPRIASIAGDMRHNWLNNASVKSMPIRTRRQIFTTHIESTRKSPDLEEHLANLIENTTVAAYTDVARGLFEKDKLIFSFVLCVDILRQRGAVTDPQWNLLLRGAPHLADSVGGLSVCVWDGGGGAAPEKTHRLAVWFVLVRIRPLRSVLTISEPWDEGDGFE